MLRRAKGCLPKAVIGLGLELVKSFNPFTLLPLHRFKRADRADVFHNQMFFEQLHNRIRVLPMLECSRVIWSS